MAVPCSYNKPALCSHFAYFSVKRKKEKLVRLALPPDWFKGQSSVVLMLLLNESDKEFSAI